MSTLEVGTKVRINNSYPADNKFGGEDGSEDEVRGSIGEVVSLRGEYIRVKPLETAHKPWDIGWLFLPGELDIV